MVLKRLLRNKTYLITTLVAYLDATIEASLMSLHTFYSDILKHIVQHHYSKQRHGE